MLNDHRFIRADSQLGKKMTKIRKACAGLIREIKKTRRSYRSLWELGFSIALLGG